MMVRTLDCWTWFGAQFFGPIRRYIPADADRTRPVEFLVELYSYCLTRSQKVAPKKTGFRFHCNVIALDSTTIKLCLSLSSCTVFHRNKGDVRLHKAIDSAGSLSQFAVITGSKHHGIREARDNIHFAVGALVIFDKRVTSTMSGWSESQRCLVSNQNEEQLSVYRGGIPKAWPDMRIAS